MINSSYSVLAHYAEGGATKAYCNCAVCHFVCLLQVFLVAHGKLRAETSNTSRYRYLLGFVLALFVSYGVICLPRLPLLTIWTSLNTKLSTHDCLAVHRFDLCYRLHGVSGEIAPKSYGKVYSYLTRVLVLQSCPADHYTM